MLQWQEHVIMCADDHHWNLTCVESFMAGLLVLRANQHWPSPHVGILDVRVPFFVCASNVVCIVHHALVDALLVVDSGKVVGAREGDTPDAKLSDPAILIAGLVEILCDFTQGALLGVVFLQQLLDVLAHLFRGSALTPVLVVRLGLFKCGISSPSRQQRRKQTDAQERAHQELMRLGARHHVDIELSSGSLADPFFCYDVCLDPLDAKPRHKLSFPSEAFPYIWVLKATHAAARGARPSNDKKRRKRSKPTKATASAADCGRTSTVLVQLEHIR